MRRLWLAAASACCAASLGSSLAAPALAETNGTQYRDWTLACRATAINQTSCVLTQILVEAGSNEFIAELGVSMQRSEGGPVAVLVMRVPVGVLLLRDPAARVDDASDDQAIRLDWQSCDATYCAATAVLSVEQTQKLQAGRAAVMGYQRLGTGQPTVFNVSLLGITAGTRWCLPANKGAACLFG